MVKDMKFGYTQRNLSFLLTIFSPFACQHSGEETPLPPQETKSFSWILANHGHQIAHFDKIRSILQIKVLDQKLLVQSNVV